MGRAAKSRPLLGAFGLGERGDPWSQDHERFYT